METPAQMAIKHLFAPASIAVVGASRNLNHLGSRYLQVLKTCGYRGKLYAVNRRAEPCGAIRGFRRLIDIPGPLALCVIAVRAAAVNQVVADCVAKAVPVAQILSGGFGETGADGLRLEQQLAQTAAGKTRLVGPNCIGVYSAPARLSLVATAASEVGTVSIASQSGGLSIDMLLQAKSRGLALNKVASIGNCLDLDPVDFLQYFGSDPETEVIGFYLEGLQRGSAFFEALKEIGKRKPVVVLKGGRTSSGAQSAASHTHALAGQYAVWQAAMVQAGAIMVDSVDAFLAIVTALQPHIPRPQGRGVGLVGNGGGTTVLTADALEEHGLILAPLQAWSRQTMAAIPIPAGASVGNPADIPIGALHASGGEALGQIIPCLLQDTNIHGVVVHFNLAPFINYDHRLDLVQGVADVLRSVAAAPKPVYVAVRATPEPALAALRKTILATTREVGLPCFQSASEAIEAFAAIYRWYNRPRRQASMADQNLSAGCLGADQACRRRLKK